MHGNSKTVNAGGESVSQNGFQHSRRPPKRGNIDPPLPFHTGEFPTLKNSEVQRYTLKSTGRTSKRRFLAVRAALFYFCHRRVLEERPCNGDALLLTAAQLKAALAHHRLPAQRQRLDQAQNLRPRRRRLDLRSEENKKKRRET